MRRDLSFQEGTAEDKRHRERGMVSRREHSPGNGMKYMWEPTSHQDGISNGGGGGMDYLINIDETICYSLRGGYLKFLTTIICQNKMLTD